MTCRVCEFVYFPNVLHVRPNMSAMRISHETKVHLTCQVRYKGQVTNHECVTRRTWPETKQDSALQFYRLQQRYSLQWSQFSQSFSLHAAWQHLHLLTVHQTIHAPHQNCEWFGPTQNMAPHIRTLSLCLALSHTFGGPDLKIFDRHIVSLHCREHRGSPLGEESECWKMCFSFSARK